MRWKNARLAAGLVVTAWAHGAFALEVDREVVPRITIGGRVIATVDAEDFDSAPDAEGQVNTKDSSLLTRFDKRLYEGGVAGGVVGLTEDEEGEIRFNELHAFFWNREFSATLGRSRLPNAVLEFPTLRDDDLLTYSRVGNASSNEEFDQIFGDFALLERRVGGVGQIDIWAGTRRDGAGVAAAEGFDSHGGGYLHSQPEALQYVKRLRRAGLRFDRQRVRGGGEEEWMNALVAGVSFNLNMNPLANWSVGLQAVATEGVGTADAADIVHSNRNVISNRARAESNAVLATVAFTRRPNLLTRWQAALTFAYKEYPDVDEATQWSVVPSLFYRIGQGVDLLAQAAYTEHGDGLGDGVDTALHLGIAFNFETLFNDTIGERRSVLNLEHGYIQ